MNVAIDGLVAQLRFGSKRIAEGIDNRHNQPDNVKHKIHIGKLIGKPHKTWKGFEYNRDRSLHQAKWYYHRQIMREASVVEVL